MTLSGELIEVSLRLFAIDLLIAMDVFGVAVSSEASLQSLGRIS